MTMGRGGIFGYPNTGMPGQEELDRLARGQQPAPTLDQPTQSAVDRYAAIPAKPSFFGEGGVGRAIAGSLGDALMQMNGLRPLYAQAMQQRMSAQRAQQDRQADWQDWVRKQEYQREHPMPTNNDTINDFNWYKSLSDQDRALYQQMRPVYRQGPDGQFYRVDVAQQPSAPPTFTQDDWDKAGGGVGNGLGNFR